MSEIFQSIHNMPGHLTMKELRIKLVVVQGMVVGVKHRYNYPFVLELQGRKVVEVLQALFLVHPLVVSLQDRGVELIGQIHRSSW